MSEDLANRYGVPYFRSAVGEANVVDAMLAHEAVFGGEGNGGPIDPRVGYVRDSFVGMALLLDAMAAREMPIGQLADELPRYEIVKRKISLPPEKLPAVLDALEKRFPDAAADRLDGLRLDWPGRWLLVRGSNTEPIVRAIAEAPTAAEAAELCERRGEGGGGRNYWAEGPVFSQPRQRPRCYTQFFVPTAKRSVGIAQGCCVAATLGTRRACVNPERVL